MSRTGYYLWDFLATPGLLLLWQILRSLTRIYMNLLTVMLFVLGRALAIHLQHIQKQVRTTCLLQQDAKALLHKWSSQHSLICKAIYKLERFFSVILLLSISCIFIQTIVYCHSVYRALSGYGMESLYHLIINIGYILRITLLFNVICYVADSLKIEVLLFGFCWKFIIYSSKLIIVTLKCSGHQTIRVFTRIGPSAIG